MTPEILIGVDNEAIRFTLQMAEPWQAASSGNTWALTKMQVSNKINTVPPTTELELDCRRLPDQDPRQFFSELLANIKDESIETTRLMGLPLAIRLTLSL